MGERQFGPYQLVHQVAVGGMAEIYLAKTQGIGGFEKFAALKMIHPNFSSDEQFIEMLIDEAKISVLLQHANVAQTFDLGRVDDIYYITMEYVDGSDLYKLLRKASERDIQTPVDVAAYIAKEVANGLDYAHRKRDESGRHLGIVHRDVSPQNVLLSYAGEVKLVDFGIAKATMKARQTAVGVIKGKYYYMSPEQAWGDPVDHRTDIFSTGILLYEALVGQMLYLEEDLHRLLDMVRKANIAPPSVMRRDIPPQLESITMRALQKKPEDRYQSAGDLAIDLERFLHVYSPVFTAAKVTEFVHQAVGEKEVLPVVAEVRPPSPDASNHTMRLEPDQILSESDDFNDENSLIFDTAGPHSLNAPGLHPMTSAVTITGTDDDGTGSIGTEPGIDGTMREPEFDGTMPEPGPNAPDFSADLEHDDVLANVQEQTLISSVPQFPNGGPGHDFEPTMVGTGPGFPGPPPTVASAPAAAEPDDIEDFDDLENQRTLQRDRGEVRQMLAQVQGGSPGQAQSAAPGQSSAQSSGQAPGQSSGQAPGQVPGQAPGQAPGQSSGQSSAQAPGQAPPGPQNQAAAPRATGPRAGGRAPANPVLSAQVPQPAISEIRPARSSRRTPVPVGQAEAGSGGGSILSTLVGRSGTGAAVKRDPGDPMPPTTRPGTGSGIADPGPPVPGHPGPGVGAPGAPVPGHPGPGGGAPGAPVPGHPGPGGAIPAGYAPQPHPQAVPGYDPQAVPGYNPQAVPGYDPQAVPGQVPHGYPPPGMPGHPGPGAPAGPGMRPSGSYQFPLNAPPDSAQFGPGGYAPGAANGFSPLPGQVPNSFTKQLQQIELEEIPQSYKLGHKRAGWLLPVLVVAVCLAVGIGLGVFLISRGDITASIIIDSMPTGAQVKVNGQLLPEPTPLQYAGAEPGKRYRMEFFKDGYQSKTQEVILPLEGGEIRVTVDLARLRRTLEITSKPTGAQIYLNNAPYGRTPKRIPDLDPDTDYTLRVTKSGYKPQIQRLTWDGKRELQLEISLQK